MPKYKVIVNTKSGKKAVTVNAPDEQAAKLAAVKEASK